ncbi:MAG TPA: hypothetical protein VGG42_18765 [Acidobacteriaceae bacterium]|jgi:hypothetical protein
MSPASGTKLHPQSGSHTDSAPGTRTHDEKASARQPQTSVHPVEPEDPKATGTSQSQKDALDLNVGRHQEVGNAGEPGHQAEEHPATPAGQHATGSFTGKNRKTA